MTRWRKTFRWDYATTREWRIGRLFFHATRNRFVPAISSRLGGYYRHDFKVTHPLFHGAVGVGSVSPESNHSPERRSGPE